MFCLVYNDNPTDLCACVCATASGMSLDRPELIKISGYRVAPEQAC